MENYSQSIKEILASIEAGKISPHKGYEIIKGIRSGRPQQQEMDADTGKAMPQESKKSGEIEAFKGNDSNPYRAIVLNSPGKVEDIGTIAVKPTDPGYGKVQVIVKAFSLNFADLLCVRGMYPNMPPYPFTPGFEFSGVVTKVGLSVKKVKPGDEVICLTDSGLGGHTLISTIDEAFVYKKPYNTSFEEACAFPVAFLTSHHVFELASVRKGEKVLIHTAAGGCGHVAVQIAVSKGAEVYATCGSDEKFSFLYSLGVKKCINYLKTDFEQEVLRATGNYGMDVVINTLPGDGIQKGLNMLAPGGRYIEIAMVGLKASKSFNLSNLTDNQSFFSVDLRRIMKNQPELWERYVEIMLKTLEQGKIKPTIGKVLSFVQVKEAYKYMEERKNIGKIVVTTQLSDEFINSQIVKEEIQNPVQLEKGCVGAGRQINRDIAVIGMACRYAGAKNVEEFWSNLSQGRCSISEVPAERWDKDKYYDPDVNRLDKTNCKWGGFLEDIDKFDPLFFNMSGREAELTDPQQRLFLEEAWKALEDAGYANERVSNTRVGVFMGIGFGDYQAKLLEEGVALEPQSFWGNSCSVSAARISYYLNLKGPSVAIDTACSSSLVAIHLGCQSIWSGDSNMVVAGGVFIAIKPNFYIMCSNAGMLSPTGVCSAFDSKANGFVPGEGVGAIVLKPLDAALKDGDNIYGVIRGSGINQDGKTNGLTAPSTISQTELETSVYEKSGINAGTLDYVEAHGTGTILGDPIEIEALTNAFRMYTDKNRFCAIGSVKTNIGHASMAAGVAGVIKVLLSLKNNKIPPMLNFTKENPYIDFDNSPFYVNAHLMDWERKNGSLRRAAVSSFGFSGTNAHLILEEPPLKEDEHIFTAKPYYLIPVSAKTKDALDKKIEDLSGWLGKEGKDCSFNDISYTLQVGRGHFNYRCIFVVKDMEELSEAIKAAMTNGEASVFQRQNAGRGPKPDRSHKTKAAEIIKAIRDEELDNNKYRRAIEELVDLYLNGYEIEWRDLYKPGEGKTLSMPVYPFADERYWIPSNIDSTSNEANKKIKDENLLDIFNKLRDGELDIDVVERLMGGL